MFQFHSCPSALIHLYRKLLQAAGLEGQVTYSTAARSEADSRLGCLSQRTWCLEMLVGEEVAREPLETWALSSALLSATVGQCFRPLGALCFL